MRLLTVFSFFFLQCMVTAQPFLMQTNRFAGATDGTVFNILTTTDEHDNMYLCGRYHAEVDFDLGPGQFTLQPGAGFFVCKYSSNGSLIWARSIGGGGNSSACRAMTIDSRGNVVIAGEFDSMIDFDPGPGTHLLYAQGTYPPNWASSGIFVLELNSAGNFVFADGWDGPKNDYVTALDVDQNDNVFLTGLFTDSLDLDPGNNVMMGNSGQFHSSFFLKLDSLGGLGWARVLDGNIRTTSMKVDKYSNVIIGGHFKGIMDFDPGSAVVNYTSAALSSNNYTSSGFIAQFNQLSGALMSVKILPPGAVESLALDTNHHLLYSGCFFGGDFDPGPGVVSYSTTNSLPDVFFGKFSATGPHLWTKHLPGSGIEWGSILDIDKQNNLVLMFGINGSCDLDPGPGVKSVASAGTFSSSFNTSFAKFDPLGNLSCGELFSTDMWTTVQSVAIDNIGKIYTTIFTDDTTYINLGSSKLNLGPPTPYRQSSILAQLHCGDIITTELNKNDRADLTVYPVPSSGLVTFQHPQLTTPITVNLFDVNGALVFTTHFTELTGEGFKLDFTNYKNGMYFLTVNSGGSIQTAKVLMSR